MSSVDAGNKIEFEKIQNCQPKDQKLWNKYLHGMIQQLKQLKEIYFRILTKHSFKLQVEVYQELTEAQI